MRKLILAVLFTALAAVSVLHPLQAGDMPKCAECGMMVDVSSRYAARLTIGGTTLHFCDIGDLLVHLREKKADPAAAQVRDYRSRELISAATARYVHAPKLFATPMGWSIAAFRDKASADEYGPSSDLAAAIRDLK